MGEALELVGLRPAHAERYPHEFSGGQRQRIGIARAIMLDPAFLVADEPVSALDVSVQAQIVNLLMEIRRRLGVTILFIAHDLAVVGYISDRIAVMYLGRIVEMAPTRALFGDPRHPYTEALLSAAPVPGPDGPPPAHHPRGRHAEPVAPPSGCAFRTRCRYALPACAEAVPPLREVAARPREGLHPRRHRPAPGAPRRLTPGRALRPSGMITLTLPPRGKWRCARNAPRAGAEGRPAPSRGS